MPVIFLTSGTSWTVPPDWSSANNKIETFGAGGSGCAGSNTFSGLLPCGGGGGAYSAITNLALTPGASITYNVGAGGAAIAVGGGGATGGNIGGDTWFNGATFAASSVAARGGNGGNGGGGGGPGGSAATGIGTIKFDGGRGGNATGTFEATGGGGAASANGAGLPGGDTAGAGSFTAGGAGGAGLGGAGGALGNNNGGSGADGSGGGGGGNHVNSGAVIAGSGGAFGGGGGGALTSDGTSTATSGAGTQGRIIITYTPPQPPIEIDSFTKLLLHCNGSNYATAFPDSSGNNHTVTVSGSVITNITQSKFGGSSARINDSGAGHLALDGSADFAFGTGDFTIDLWINQRTLPTALIYDGRLNSATSITPVIYYVAGAGLRYFVNGGDQIVGTTQFVAGAWHHVALTRSGTSTRLFLNGVQQGATYTDTNNYINPGAGCPSIGDASNDGNPIDGWLDEIQVSKGIARWTANFTVPSAPYFATSVDASTVLLLQFDGVSGGINFPDTSGKNHAVTRNGTVAINTSQGQFNSSAYFDGSSTSSLSLDGSNDFAYGTGDFTIDFWVRFNAITTAILYDGRGPAQTPTIWVGSGVWRYWTNGADQIVGSAPAINTWYHVALVRSAGVTNLYVNGTQQGTSYTDTTNYVAAASRPVIGSSGGSSLNGYLDEFRVSKGIARWTANFTPPPTAYGIVQSFATQTVLVTPGTTTWTVPTDWNNANNTIECLGGGGKGGTAGVNGPAGGGGGGGYSRSFNLALTPGTVISVTAGAAGTTGATNGGDTSFNLGAVLARGGAGASGSNGQTAGGAGGTAVSGVGTTKFSGGNGGTQLNGNGGLGGGGAAGPNGNGGNGSTNGPNMGGAGGGGANGGGAGSAPTSVSGAAGGNNRFGAGGGPGGAASTPGTGGTAGGGGGGGGGTAGGAANAGVGGNSVSADVLWGSAGPAGGGGGGGGVPNGTGAPGNGGSVVAGNGGGGGGGGNTPSIFGTGGNGGPGILVITYLQAPQAFVATNLATGSPVLDTPVFVLSSVALTALDLVPASPVLGTPVLTQNHVLTAQPLTTASPAFGTPSVSAAANLSALNLVTASPVLGTPAFTQIHNFTALALTTASPVLDTPIFTLAGAFIALPLVTGSPVLGTPAIGSPLSWWFVELSRPPTLTRARLLEATQVFATIDASLFPPVVASDWFIPLSEPRMLPRWIGSEHHGYVVETRTLIPNAFVTMHAIETADTFRGGIYAFNPPVETDIGVVERNKVPILEGVREV